MTQQAVSIDYLKNIKFCNFGGDKVAKKVILENTFASELKRCRARTMLTQANLSVLTGIPLSNIKAWECGKQMPNFENWQKLYEFFKTRYIGRELEQAYTREKGQ